MNLTQVNERMHVRRFPSIGHGWVIAAVVVLLLSSVSVQASEGYISLYYTVEGVGDASYTLNHCSGAAEGLDDQDNVWYWIACLQCQTDTKVVASVDGRDLNIDNRPIDSESGATVRCGVVSKTGDSITLTNAAQWVDIYVSGFDGYDVMVNGLNARQTSRIDLDPVTGTFSSGSMLETFTICFGRQDDYVPEDPDDEDEDTDEDGDDPAVEDPVSNETVPDALFITNAIQGCPAKQTGVWTLLHDRDALDAIDVNDVAPASPFGEGFRSLIVSTIADPVTGERHVLAVDARPPDSREDIDLCIGVESASNESISFAPPATNELIFSFPTGAKDCFAGKTITFQLYDPADPRTTYPVWDVRKIVANNQGVLSLQDLTDSLVAGVPYLCARVSTSRQLGDVLRDGRIDVNDYNQVASQEGLAGSTDADIASSSGLGLPDGVVDVWDLHYLYELLADTDKAQVTRPALPFLTEGFESGDLEALNWVSLQWPHWLATSDDRHSGTYSARPGKITDDESTALSLTLDCTAGRISFWRRISTEYNWDLYRFYIDNKLQEELSGEIGWSEVSFDIEAGAHTFRWQYEKDSAGSSGKDTFYLDDLTFPARQ
ncbi:MAG: hypothetical protein ACM3VT_13550 [Solirubrobacterales bacterium]